MKIAPEQALRYNQGKSNLSYVLSAPNAIDGLSAVMAYGSAKYARDNWKKGLPYTEVIDSLLRHLTAFSNGEDSDPESLLPHIDHVLCNAFFLAEFTRTQLEHDDRTRHILRLNP